MTLMRLEDYGISAARGFLPAEDPLQRLPSYFEPWEQIAASFSKLLIAGKIRAALSAMPLLSVNELEGERVVERAMLLLSYFGHAWVWGERQPLPYIPRQLAIPWCSIANLLDRPPVLSYASHALRNWRRLEMVNGVELGNIVRSMSFLGGLDEEWFVLIHIAIEATAGPIVVAITQLLDSVETQDNKQLIESLRKIALGMAAVTRILERMPEMCDPYIYFRRVRPFIFGWEGNPALPLGMLYEGVEAHEGRPLKLRGETGAQSSIVPSVDAALGIDLSGSATFARHLRELRTYMPVKHREFLGALEKHNKTADIRGYVQRHSAIMPAIGDAYNAAVRSVADFRSVHCRFANNYIAKQAAATPSNPSDTGTGGTPFIQYLREHVEITLSSQIG